ncbi:LacI family DNA-binding transcriptional regulator [Oenococcus oeni]|uniref:LacI family DNA-binding transcriptional regulator n=3 Tax=Oenococcus oeni TaxID=1247 RepID=UPI000BDF33CF|nr:LacI family DNA-binding transcriptional regulator [Oenococcus oeni]PDH74892.1 transcriptional regulator [Oenococcus oeni]PDH87014.1 transcriptional regulator [Oenococcus oeni]PDH88474.1 transcriptional regulator [Oenococcus oeni]PDH90431.1 transcriptional regulator [Oenococcus oeni]PDH90456.1 transcriptional regulator [Oenococcus oeni]
MEKLTIKDIANLVNVSTATVSNYINGNYSRMSDTTQRKIEDMIKETNYIPNSIARGLATNDSRTIGVSIADITNPFTSTVLSGIYDTCGKLGYNVFFTNASSDPKREINNINKLKHQETSGLIIDPVNAESPIFKTIGNERAVMVDRQASIVKLDTIVTDNFNSVKQFVNNMRHANYADVYFVSWPLQNVSTRLQRYHGFLEATGIHDDSHLISIENSGGEQAFQNTLKQLMLVHDKRKIGFFSMNGRVLIRLLKAMQALNYEYPADYGVGTYEDLDWMEIIRPGISCIHQDSFQLGVTAVNTLHNKLLKKNSRKPKLILVPTSIKKRESY